MFFILGCFTCSLFHFSSFHIFHFSVFPQFFRCHALSNGSLGFGRRSPCHPCGLVSEVSCFFHHKVFSWIFKLFLCFVRSTSVFCLFFVIQSETFNIFGFLSVNQRLLILSSFTVSALLRAKHCIDCQTPTVVLRAKDETEMISSVCVTLTKVNLDSVKRSIQSLPKRRPKCIE